MTKEDFLPTLSEKAQNIVNDNMKFWSNNRTFSVFYSNNCSKAVSKNNCDYVIYVKNDISKEIECRFLHEFFHCVQFEEGFPSLVGNDDKYKELATFLSSIILDLNVMKQLEDNGYFQHIKYIEKSIDSSIKFLELLEKYNLKEEITNTIDIINMAGLIITSELTNINNKKFVMLIKKLRPKVFEYYTVFFESLKMYSYNTAEDVKEIFEYLLKHFNLTSFIKIRTHCNY